MLEENSGVNELKSKLQHKFCIGKINILTFTILNTQLEYFPILNHPTKTRYAIGACLDYF